MEKSLKNEQIDEMYKISLILKKILLKNKK